MHSSVSVTASTSTSTDVVPVASGSLSVDRAGTIDLTSSESRHSSDDEFPPFPATSEYLPKERLYEIFSQVSSSAVDNIVDLCNGDATHALKILLGGPKVVDLLQLNAQKVVHWSPEASDDHRRGGFGA